jgi:hypothetical protein
MAQRDDVQRMVQPPVAGASQPVRDDVTAGDL